MLLECCAESSSFQSIVTGPGEELRSTNGETLARGAPKRWRHELIEVDPVVNDAAVRLKEKTRALLVAAVSEINL